MIHSDLETVALSQLVTLVLHGSDGCVPLLQALPVRLEVKPGNSHFSGDDGMHRGPSICWRRFKFLRMDTEHSRLS